MARFEEVRAAITALRLELGMGLMQDAGEAVLRRGARGITRKAAAAVEAAAAETAAELAAAEGAAAAAADNSGTHRTGHQGIAVVCRLHYILD